VLCVNIKTRRRPTALCVPIHWDVKLHLKHEFDCFQISSWNYYILRLWLRFLQITLLFIHSYIHYSSLGGNCDDTLSLNMQAMDFELYWNKGLIE
jgi:uncharacterized membrane protein YcgQ (UPF0703/DUF1980 family)